MPMRPETLYVVYPSETSEHPMYGRTPDGVGMYWYGDIEEARGDVCEPDRTRQFNSYAEFDEWRGAMEASA